jgi:hypothetical protein
MRGLFKLLLVFGLVYFIVKYIFRLIMLFIPQKNNMHLNNNDNISQEKNQSKKRFSGNDGEYIDFEEVK